MSNDTATKTSLFDPIRVRYDGLDAIKHQIDLHDFGKSAQGISKIISTVASFVLTNNYDPSKRKLDCRVTIEEPQANCFSFTAMIQYLDASPFMYTATATVASGLFLLVFQYIWAVVTGKNREMQYLQTALVAAIEQLGRRDDVNRLMDTIDKMAAGLLPAAKDATHPIGNTCETLKFGNANSYYVELNDQDKQAIREQDFDLNQEQSYRVLISELDMKKFTCKVSPRDELDVRYNGKIVDPQVELPNNPYATAMSSKNLISVRAQQKLFDGKIKEFIITGVYDDNT